jgi:transcriptional regulator with XRE-family HTH domain
VPGPHPAHAILKARGLSYAEVAADPRVDVRPDTVRQVVCGYINTWPRIRAALADYFDLPESVLFHDREAVRS